MADVLALTCHRFTELVLEDLEPHDSHTSCMRPEATCGRRPSYVVKAPVYVIATAIAVGGGLSITQRAKRTVSRHWNRRGIDRTTRIEG